MKAGTMMSENIINEEFFAELDSIVSSTKIIIDRPKGSQHPRYAQFVYMTDFGYLQNTLSTDGGGIDVWKGSLKTEKVGAIVVTVEPIRKNSQIKLLCGCTLDEEKMICDAYNKFPNKSAILIRRP